MKTQITFAIVCTAAFLLGFALDGKNLIRNGDFEKFKGNEPVGWETSNVGKLLTVVSPVSNAHGGTTAVKCDVKNGFGSPTAGMILQKNIPLNGDAIELSLYYALSSVGKDVGFLAVDFQSEEGSTVGMWQQNLTSTAPGFTLFKNGTKLPKQATHCELRLTLMPEKDGGTVHEGSSITIDDMAVVSLEPRQETPAP